MHVDKPGMADNIERVLVIIFLGIASIAALVGGIWLTSHGKDVPDMMQILGATAIGALGGMLSGGHGKN